MKYIKKHSLFLILIFFIFSLFPLSSEDQNALEAEQEILSKERTPIIFALGEGLNNPHLAQDEDIGVLDISSHPRTVVAYEFLEAYMKGKIRSDLIISDSQQVLQAYMQDLRKNHLRYTSFRLGMAKPQSQGLYEIHGKLIGYGKKTLILLTMMQQNNQNWKILAFSADYPL